MLNCGIINFNIVGTNSCYMCIYQYTNVRFLWKKLSEGGAGEKWRSCNALAIVNGHNKNSGWNGAQVGLLSRG